MGDVRNIELQLKREFALCEGSLAQRVYVTLKRTIMALDFPPGAILRKTLICDVLGVSRAPVSEAIARLDTEGLVDVVPQSGTRVSYFSMAEIREGAFFREALELATVSRVAATLSDEQQMKLNRNIRLQELLIEDGDIPGFYDADEQFHHLLMEFTGFTRLVGVAQTVSLQVNRARMLLLPTPGRIAETLSEHRAIYTAICNHDEPAARDAMRFHLGQLMPRIEILERTRPDLFNMNPSTMKEAE